MFPGLDAEGVTGCASCDAASPQTQVEHTKGWTGNSLRGIRTGLFIIPTCQRSALDLVRTGDTIEQEKDRLLERVCNRPIPKLLA